MTQHKYEYQQPKCAARSFLRSSEGSIAGNLFWFAAIATVFGIALDSANAWRVEQELQVAADASASAAAANAADPDLARTIGAEVAARNLKPETHGTPITTDDIVVGFYDDVTGTFTETDEDANAAFVVASRDNSRHSAVSTYLMGLSGISSLDVHASALAIQSDEPGGCEDATILTTNFLNTGGRNVWMGSVCLHGETGVLTGGDDYYDERVRISAANASDIVINTVAAGSATADQITLERSMTPTILPNLNSMFSSFWGDAAANSGSTYNGDQLPAFLKGAKVEVLGADWVVLKEPGTLRKNEQGNPGVVEVQSNTIYLAPGGVTFEGNVDASGIAILAKGQIIIGGGSNLYFQDVLFFAESDINASGTVRWGHPDSYCNSGVYNSYLFSKTALSLGGATGVYGVVGAAPFFAPGGAMESAGGVYFEASQYTSLGGQYDVAGCDAQMESAYEIARPGRARKRASKLIQ